MSQLFDAGRHETLAEIPWDAAAVRAAIERISIDAHATFTREALWPIHPDDGPAEQGSFIGLYFGAAGVVWGLDYLRRQGLSPDVSWPASLFDEMEARDQPFLSQLGPMAAGYLLGETGLLFARWRATGEAALLDRLAARISANSTSPALELMWGAPGTMLVALALHEATGEARWADLFRTGEEALRSAFKQVPAIGAGAWTQDLYGRRIQYLGAVHGLAGNAFVLIKGRHLLAPEVWAAWSSDLIRSTEATSRRDGQFAGWPAMTRPPGDNPGAAMLVQHCHGAPGVITCLAGLDAPIDNLLLAGGELTWRAGPLKKGSNLCHGTGGNGYAFLKLFERTGDALWLDRARAFAMHALAQSEAQAAKLGRRRYSLWTGDLGLACYLWDCLEGQARFPALDVL
jgi:hypothetical protein